MIFLNYFLYFNSCKILGGGGFETENIYSDYRNKTGSLEQELKAGKYKIIGKAIDNNGLEGQDEVEIVVG